MSGKRRNGGAPRYCPDIPISVRPLAHVAQEAEKLGFKLYWRDDKPVPPVRPRGRFFVRLLPATERAKDATERASGDRGNAVQTATWYDETFDYLDIVRQTGEQALENARSIS